MDLDINLGPSKVLTIFFLVGHFIAAICVFYLPVFLFFRVLLVMFLILTCCFYIYKYALLKSRSSIVRLILGGDDSWQLQDRSGKSWYAELGDEAYIARFVILLHFRSNRKCAVVLPFDAVDRNAWRNLRKYILLSSRLAHG